MSVETAATVYDQLSIDAENADKLFLEARTANTFSQDAVSEETLEAIYELTKMGPTMMNNQPLRITWVKSQEAREAVVAKMMEGNRAKSSGLWTPVIPSVLGSACFRGISSLNPFNLARHPIK